MQVNETLNDGLARELTITVAKNDMETQLVERLTKMKGEVQLKGFRQGKVPISHLRKVYGKQGGRNSQRIHQYTLWRSVEGTWRKACSTAPSVHD